MLCQKFDVERAGEEGGRKETAKFVSSWITKSPLSAITGDAFRNSNGPQHTQQQQQESAFWNNNTHNNKNNTQAHNNNKSPYSTTTTNTHKSNNNNNKSLHSATNLKKNLDQLTGTMVKQ